MNHLPISVGQSSATWGGLRKAIANTPGFQYWLSDLGNESQDLDALVQIYLRETLETLAY